MALGGGALQGAELNARRGDRATALCDTAMGGHAEAVRILCEHGADVNAADDDGDGPLYYARDSAHAECERILLEHSAQLVTGSGTIFTPQTLPPGFQSESHRRCHARNELPAEGRKLSRDIFAREEGLVVPSRTAGSESVPLSAVHLPP
ncbi:hypothetical protein T484DRAFT_1787382 [Baffinella frigidus]|nr:hypothetical protein T484DRAFT_1787382 [Cryptophyta sp. CCMP2293]